MVEPQFLWPTLFTHGRSYCKKTFSLDGKLEVVDVGIGFLNNALPPVKYAHVTYKSEEDTDKVMGLQVNHLKRNRSCCLQSTKDMSSGWKSHKMFQL